MKTARQFALFVAVACIISYAGTVHAEELQVRQPTQDEIGKIADCPVKNERFEVGKDTPVIDYKGNSYYFCCPHCVGNFKNNPDKYVPAEELPLRHPTKDEIGKSRICPVSNAEFPVTSDTPVIDYKGNSYYFCCVSCIDEFKKNPDKFSK